MNQNFSSECVNALEKLKSFDHERLYEFQKAHIPLIGNMTFQRVYDFKYLGQTQFYDSKKIFLKVTNLPIKYDAHKITTINNIKYFIDNKFIKPFILFQDGKFVNWDKITLYMDWSDNYFVIDSSASHYARFESIVFPYDIIISTNATVYDINDKTLFMFNNEGKYINYKRFTGPLSNNALPNSAGTNFGINADWPQKLDPTLEAGSSLTEEVEVEKEVDGELITVKERVNTEQKDLNLKTVSPYYSGFPDGSKLASDAIYYQYGDTYTMITRKNDNENQVHLSGRYTNWYANMYIDGIDKRYLIGNVNFICFDENGLLDTNAVSVNELNEFRLDKIGKYFDFFYHKFNNISMDNSRYITKNENILNASISLSPLVSGINIPLSMSFSREKTYEENCTENEEKLFYKPEILLEVNDKFSPIKTITISGQEFKRSAINGFVKLFRTLDDSYQCKDSHIMVFVNGELLSNYGDNYTKDNSFYVPVNLIKYTDSIELVYFNNVDNRYFEILMPEDGYDITKFDSSIDINNIEIFTKDAPSFMFNISNKPNVYLPLDYEIIDNKIVVDEFYHNKYLYIAFKNQWHHCHYNINGLGIRARLTNEFNFCDKKENYIVFINGRKQNDFHFTEMTSTRPFTEKAIYTHKLMNVGDRIDIFYLPYKSEIVDIEIDKYGNIIGEDNYFFDKPMSLLFLNGKKVSHSDIEPIPLNGLRVIKNYNTMKNVQLFRMTESMAGSTLYYNEIWDAINNLPSTLKDDLLNNRLLDSPSEDMINYSKDITSDQSLGAVFAGMLQGIEKHYSILNTGRMLNGLNLSVMSRSKNTIDDIESDLSSDVLSATEVLYEIIKDYYVAPNINNGYATVFYYDYDPRILNIDDKVLINGTPTDIYIIRLLTAYNQDKIPQYNVMK